MPCFSPLSEGVRVPNTSFLKFTPFSSQRGKSKTYDLPSEGRLKFKPQGLNFISFSLPEGEKNRGYNPRFAFYRPPDGKNLDLEA